MKPFRILWRKFASRPLCDRSGLAAVEFALILPLMLTLYFGIVTLAKGYMASERTTLVARTIADLTAQLTAQSPPPPLSNATMSTIFAASSAIMAPFTTTTATPTMTVSEIQLIKKSDGTCCQAWVDWTITSNGGTARPCQILTPANAAPVSPTTIPIGFTTPPSTIGTILIVADVTYAYSTGYGFDLYKWNIGKTFNMAQTQYMLPRGSQKLTYAATTGKQCPSPPP
jgi:Flp pilus assembly protein TadG